MRQGFNDGTSVVAAASSKPPFPACKRAWRQVQLHRMACAAGRSPEMPTGVKLAFTWCSLPSASRSMACITGQSTGACAGGHAGGSTASMS